ncbi:hypothetical protein N7541_006185 [Penicillium brevicompactum]|uniref:Uncharacterized protein n=1 Tax=Penicillium brevicompactum TaxID=5074 RepID=A0A9W9UT00_PENBR|nr:hypothetical protein N7541_006185 [Penicillium brevicompactum]
MDHVSTLCALSTVGIAPAGLALGRADRTQRPSLFRRKTLAQDLPTQPPMPVEAKAVDPRPKTAAPSRSPAAEWLAAKEEELAPAQCEGSDLRRASMSFSAARRRRRGQTLMSPPLQIPENESTDSPTETHARRPSTGWLRRLSMASFNTESPSAQSPTTPSFSGSASPMFPQSPGQRRLPNKLVKRPASQQASMHAFGMNTISGPSPAALRRPATSHQRSESMILQTPVTTDFETYFPKTPAASPAVEDFDVEKQKQWSPFFLPKAGKLVDMLSRRFSTSTAPKAQSVRQIVSDQGSLPALVMASEISSGMATPRGEKSVPDTPVEFRNPFQSAAPKPTLASQPPVQERSSVSKDSGEQRNHKHSYSCNDVEPKVVMANTVTAHGKPIMGLVRGGSLKRVKGRTFSIPRSELARGDKKVMIPSSPAPERRNITDPTVFQPPHPISQPGWAVSALERRAQVGPRSVSQDYDVGLGSRGGSRPLNSDDVALSAWQQASRPGGPAAYGSLRRRPKGFSISGSDPSSTVIGSDDTRVFTSCDEYETDVMSDYWDSIRTRETSTSGLKGLRIETMFDKAGASLVNEEATSLEALLPRGSFAARSERDPRLFPESYLVSPPLTHVSMADQPPLADGADEDSLSMIGSLPGDDRPAFASPPNDALSKYAEADSPFGSPISQIGPFSGASDLHVNKKANIFDWSEQTRPDRDSGEFEARPRTMQGKQEGVDRSSRAVCRKAPSTVHLRSQSVPVASELPTNESRQTSGKFGTWGLGSKGVSEDWDSDFDFDESEETPVAENKQFPEPDPNRQSMTVPKAILERQASLRGQFGQVQELTLLVEELKRLRHQANTLDIVTGPSSELWKEAEQIVNLATIDEEEERRSPPGSPSSLTFSFDESDDDGLHTASSKRDSEVSWDVHGDSEHVLPLSLAKDSPKSKSVLDLLQSREPKSALQELDFGSRTKKLPFDTSSLKNLVVRAGVVTRALKEVIRKAEGVASSPRDFPHDPPFRRIFDKPDLDFDAALAEMS